MEFTKNNKTGYTQAIISMLIIFCTFLPFAKPTIENGWDTYHRTTSAMLEYTTFLAADKKTYIGVFFVISMMLQLVNILVQPRRNNATLPIVAGLTGGISILMLHIQIDKVENEHYYIDYTWGFYLMLILYATQAMIPFFAYGEKETEKNELKHENIDVLFEQKESHTCKDADKTAVTAENETIVKTEASSPVSESVNPIANKEMDEQLEIERHENELLKEELRMLKAKAEQVQKEKKLKENIEKERQEKEMLLKEIAKLKRQLEESENNA